MPNDTANPELSNLTEASEILLAETPRWARTSIYLMVLLLLSGLIWGYVGSVDLVVRAPGIVRPDGKVVRVQSEVAGRVLALAVREGATVEAGQTLIQLDASELEVQRKKLRTLRELRKAKVAQLRSDREQRAAQGTVELGRLRVAGAEAEASLTHTRRTAQARQEARQAAIEASEAATVAATKEWEATQKLYEAKAASEQQLVKAESGKRRAIAEEARARALAKVGTDDVTVAERVVDLRGKEREAYALQLKRELEALDAGLRAAENAVADVDRDLETLSHQLSQLAMRAPVGGTVTSLKIRSVGEVASPGQTLMTIAPEGARPVMEARVANRDIGSIREGMPVRMKFHAFPHRDYGVVSGRVVRIPPDAIDDPLRGSVYEVTVDLPGLTVANGTGRAGKIALGMSADVEIIKERSRILKLLVRKFRDRLDHEEAR